MERILLQTIKFDLQVDHPYGFLLKYAKCLKGNQDKMEKLVQMAWNFVNDSLSTTVCLQWEPEVIAITTIHLASKLNKFTVADWEGRQEHHLRWWEMFVADVEMEVLEDICHQVLDLYQQEKDAAGPPPDSPPQLPPSKSSPPMKRANLATKVAPGMPIKTLDDTKMSMIPSVVATSAALPPSIRVAQDPALHYPPTYSYNSSMYHHPYNNTQLPPLPAGGGPVIGGAGGGSSGGYPSQQYPPPSQQGLPSSSVAPHYAAPGYYPPSSYYPPST